MSIKSVSISFNRDVDVARKEQEKWESKGYVVTETYGTDWDCGQILELPEEDNDVMERHFEHMRRCNEHWKWIDENILNK